MTTQKINFKTNYNNKLDCPHFVHLDLAPRHSIPETKLDNTIDKSHQPVEKKVVDIARAKFKDISAIFFHLSHGMTKQQYLDISTAEKKQINSETEMAIYYYSPTDYSARV